MFLRLETVLSLHDRVAYALVLYYGALGVWGILLGARSAGPSPGLRGAIVIALIASIVQGTLGLLVLAFRGPPRDALHLLYGFTLVLAVPLAASIVRARSPRARSLVLGIAALFTAGLAIRGIITA